MIFESLVNSQSGFSGYNYDLPGTAIFWIFAKRRKKRRRKRSKEDREALQFFTIESSTLKSLPKLKQEAKQKYVEQCDSEDRGSGMVTSLYEELHRLQRPVTKGYLKR